MGIESKDITSILNCFKEERFQDAHDLLQKVIQKDKNNHHLYYLKAISCIRMEKLDEALIDLGEVAYLNPNHVPSMHALAYLFLKRGDFEGAVSKWLSIKTIAPKDDLALAQLKKTKDQKLSKDAFNKYNINDFIILDFKALKKGLMFNFDVPTPTTLKPLVQPTFKKNLPSDSFTKKASRKITSLVKMLFFCLAIGVFIAGFIIYKVELRHKAPNSNKQETLFKQFLNKAPIKYTYSEKEVTEQKNKISELVDKKSYNQATLAINKFYFSNANLKDKQDIKALQSELNEPENKKELDVEISLNDILDNPIIYNGIYTSLKGSVTELKNHPGYLSFELMMDGNHKISVAFLDSSIKSMDEDLVEVFGKIIYQSKDQSVSFEGKNLSLDHPKL